MTQSPTPAQLTVADARRALQHPWADQLDGTRRVYARAGNRLFPIRGLAAALIDGQPALVADIDGHLWTQP